MSKQPIGFMSYVRFDDAHNEGRITEFCERLSNEVRTLLGGKFDIFQDKNDISWGQQWEQRLNESIDASTFLIPIITPSFFNSEPCRKEMERFLKREKKLNRADLILPVYYVKCQVLDDERKRQHDPLAQIIAGRNFFDWREMRFEPFTNPDMWRAFNRMAQQIVDAMERGVISEKTKVSVREDVDETEGELEAVSEADVNHSNLKFQKVVEKSEPPTHIVDALHRGHFTTLTQALKISQAGDRILVRSGTYREAIVIDKPLEIIGDGALGEVVIESNEATTVKFQASMGRLSNLVLRQISAKQYFCIDILQGRLDIDGCDISSKGFSGVSIRAGASPQLRRNKIHSCGQAGILIRENSSGTFEDNEIFGNLYSNLAVKGGANPTIRRNRIYESKQSGVYVYEQGLGLFEDNEVFGNGTFAALVEDGSNPVFRRNRLYESKKHGVKVNSHASGTFEDNEIFSNGRAGVLVSGESSPQLRRNNIHINAHSGVLVDGGSKPIFDRNRIHSNKQGGVYCYETGEGVFEKNEVFSNARNGFLIKGNASPALYDNVVTGNGRCGVWIGGDAKAEVRDNDLRGNKHGPLHIEQGAVSEVIKQGNLED